jgi:serine/threonine protein kinase
VVTASWERTIQPGETFDRYVIQAKLGEGGAASVFRARHRDLGTYHAIKVLRLGGGNQIQRLIQEGRIQATLRHPHIVSVTDVVRVGPFPALVMEYISGPSLEQLLLRYRPTHAEIDSLARQILEGMRAAHEQGLIHRDLKPANILLEVGKDRVTAKISDFGLARVIEPDGQPTRKRSTRSGVLMGTPAFMAPEQLREARDADHRADIFALGAIFYELASGAPAFMGENVMSIYQASSTGTFRPLDEVAPELPERWVAAVHAALRPQLTERVQTIEGLHALWAGGTDAPQPQWDFAHMRGLSDSVTIESFVSDPTPTATIIPDLSADSRPPLLALAATGAMGFGLTWAAVVIVGLLGFGLLQLLRQDAAVQAPHDPLPVLPPLSSPGRAPAEPVPFEEPAQPDEITHAPPRIPLQSARGEASGTQAEPSPSVEARAEPLSPADPEPVRTRFEVTGVEKAWLEDSAGRRLRPGDIDPGEYVLHVFFDAAKSTQVMTLSIEAGEQRAVRCDSLTRICK